MERAAVIIGVLWLLIGCPRAIKSKVGAKPSSATRSEVEAILAELRKRHGFPAGVSFRAKYQAVYDGERKQPFQLRLMSRDSLLWVSASLMGFEGLRALWQSDSLILLNRLSREAFVGKIDSLRNLFPPLKGADLSAFLLGFWAPSLDSISWRWFPHERLLRGRLGLYEIEVHLTNDKSPEWWRLIAGTDTFLLEYTYSKASATASPSKIIFTLPDASRLILTPKEIERETAPVELSISIPEGYSVKPLSDFNL